MFKQYPVSSDNEEEEARSGGLRYSCCNSCHLCCWEVFILIYLAYGWLRRRMATTKEPCLYS